MPTFRPRNFLLLAAAFFLLLPSLAAADAQDWPGYRGPNRDGISAETGILKSWPEGGPKLLWSVPLGGGFSGLTAVDGRIYTIFSRDGKEILGAFDADTGREAWSVGIDRERKDRFGDGPRSTPLVHDGVVYAVSALGHLVAVSAENGGKLWDRLLQKDLGARVPTWGVSASPVVEGDLLLFNAGGDKGRAIVAFDKKTGEVKWKSESDIPGYSLPITFTAGGVRQTVFFSGTSVIAVAPQTGKTLWTYPWKTAYDVNAAAPIFIPPDKLFVSSGYDTGSAMLRVRKAGDAVTVEPMWKSRRMKNQFSSSVYHQGYIYGFDNKNLKCIDAKNGEDCWRKGGLGHGSLVYADGHLIVLGEGGELVLVEATPREYVEKARAQVASGKHWTVPTLYDGKLYVRNERELYCYRFRAG